jgi:outer membrane protein assembly factor BamD
MIQAPSLKGGHPFPALEKPAGVLAEASPIAAFAACTADASSRSGRRVATALAVACAIGLGGCASSDYDPTANWSADRLYADAKGELASGNWAAATKALQKLESRYPFGRYAQQAQLDLAWASYKEGDRAEALVAVERFIRLHPTHERLDYAFYLKGLINFNSREGLIARMAGQDLSERDQQASREAYESFKQVVTRFPESRYAEDSVARMKFLVNAMASGEVHIARYYYSRGAYVAAVSRAQDVVAVYKQTPAVEEALHLMVISYDKLNLTELRDDTLRVLERTFPQSRFLEPARRVAAAGTKTASN